MVSAHVPVRANRGDQSGGARVDAHCALIGQDDARVPDVRVMDKIY